VRLGRRLATELRRLGLADARQEASGIVLATLPATVDEAPVIGLLAHLDTSPQAPGRGVQPRLLARYDGAVVPFPNAPALALDPAEDVELRGCIGHDLVFGAGDTLLGADDKAGVAAIMAAVEYLQQHPDRPRPTLRIAFTPDEEVAGGIHHLDLDAFGAVAGYTLDGGGAGVVEAESFSADRAVLRVHGNAAHPGMAGPQLVNALRIVARFVSQLDLPTPETTSGREGFVHPYQMHGTEESAEVTLILRSFDTAELRAQEARLRQAAAEAARAEPRATWELEVSPQYRNMAETLARSPDVVERAVEAIRRAGLGPRFGLIRGGTDGSILSNRGLPCPNLFSGQHRIHSTREWLCAQELGLAAETLIHLAAIWAGR